MPALRLLMIFLCTWLKLQEYLQDLGEIGLLYTISKNPEEDKRAKIAENEERNMSINNQAKSKAFDAPMC
ncbi:hypothetical protein SDC9_158873 [bioreactor metagenome]|uniref:Uncharacterized protein n=1 Tax=bioreactor metagenome TaxID=1076179 RepID=A0A645FCC8_9ZZZZ